MADRPEKPDAVLHASPDTVVWGAIPADREPVLRIRPGQCVRIDTVSQQPLNNEDPEKFFAAAGIEVGRILPEAIAIFRQVKKSPPHGPHVLTGPIYIEGAEPGDMLEVRVLDVAFRVPYGVNGIGPGSGVLPDLLSARVAPTIRLDLDRNVALFAGGTEVPLAPFMGIMSVAPPPERAPASTKPPGEWGGNIDFKHLTAGSTLYLPVFNQGALFYTGDGHAAQGDGEVDGAAIEISLAPTFQFFVRKGRGAAMKWPRAEDAACFYVMGMDEDLDVALREAVREAVEFIQRRACITAAEAYALASFNVDFRIGEAVNIVKMVYGAIPKKLFTATAS
ncbi:MAG: acetamidase/formamidase family protein [Burkholderiales bacterium]